MKFCFWNLIFDVKAINFFGHIFYRFFFSLFGTLVLSRFILIVIINKTKQRWIQIFINDFRQVFIQDKSRKHVAIVTWDIKVDGKIELARQRGFGILNKTLWPNFWIMYKNFLTNCQTIKHTAKKRTCQSWAKLTIFQYLQYYAVILNVSFEQVSM